MANKPDKGIRGGSCNRTACQAPGANFYNRSTQMWYCETCAHAINDFEPGRRDSQRLYGDPDLVIPAAKYDAEQAAKNG